MANDTDRIEDMERSDTKHKLPIGWLMLYIGLILWGIFYSFAYTPATGGWSQESEYLESIKK